MTRPDVSVVIPTRNRPDLLPLTLHSVLRQRDVLLEVLVVDDGDGPEITALAGTFADPRLRLLRNRGLPGVAGARNCGVAAARGAWIAFCDDDDLWAPRKLSAQLAASLACRAEWAYAGAVNVDLDLRVLSGAPPPPPAGVLQDLPRYNSVPAGASNVLVRAGGLARAGRFDPALRTSEDWDMWLRLAAVAGQPACVDQPLVALRMHRGMSSRDPAPMFGDLELIARRHRNPIDMARHHRWAAWMALEDGDRRRALQQYACAVRAGNWTSAGRAVVGLLHPRVVRRRQLPAADPWARAAQPWLDDLRRSARCVAGGGR